MLTISSTRNDAFAASTAIKVRKECTAVRFKYIYMYPGIAGHCMERIYGRGALVSPAELAKNTLFYPI